MAIPVNDDPVAHCNAYRRLGWQVELDIHDQIILPADQVHAVQVCPALAEPVLEQLRHAGVVTPVIDNAATRTRTFLTTSPQPGDDRGVRLFLPEAPVWAIRTVAGSLIRLPTPGCDIRVWREEPRPSRLASFELGVSTAFDAARTVRVAA